MEAKLSFVLNGKEFQLNTKINPKQLGELCGAMDDTLLEEIAKSEWEKPQIGDLFYYEDAAGRVQSVEVTEATLLQTDMLYEAANCYMNPQVASDMARAHMLKRKLRRFAATHPEENNRCEKNKGFTILYNYTNRCLEIGASGEYLALGDITFNSEHAARDAINTFSEELIWYFTESHEEILMPGIEEAD